MKITKSCCIVFVLAALLAPRLRAGLLTGDGIAVYGDSASMQYSLWLQPIFGSGIFYNGTQLNWVDHLSQSGYNFGPTTTFFGAPYRSYDVAIAGQKTADLAAQVTAAQSFVTSAAAKVVVLEMGANDFGASANYSYTYNNAANPLYQPLSDPLVQGFINTQIGNITAAVNATLAENASTEMVLMTIPDVGGTIPFQTSYPASAQRAAVTQVLNAVNSGIRSLAALHHIPVVDYAGLAQLTTIPPVIAGVQMINDGGTTGNYEFLSDKFHPGTVLQGVLGNVVLEAIHRGYGDAITLVSDQTILTRAGLTPTGPSPTFFDVSPYVIVPEPSTLVLAGLAAVGLTVASRRRHRCKTCGHVVQGRC